MLAGETVLIDVILIVALAVLVGVYVSWRAGRLDRLHARVDIARAALFLASDQAGFVTGHTLHVNGGSYLY